MKAIIYDKNKVNTQKVIDELGKNITKRNLYLMLITLKKDFGFGEKRLKEVATKFYENSEEFSKNPTWLDEAGYTLSKQLGEDWQI